MFQWIDEAEMAGGDGTYYLPPEHAESWVFFEASLARTLLDLTKRVLRGGGKKIEIRPHPFEQKVRYQYFEQLGKGLLAVNKQGSISEWLQDKFILFTFLSASAIDAIVRGIPVVSLKNLIDRDALQKIPGQFNYNFEAALWQLETTEQVEKYIDLAQKGKLLPCRDEQWIKLFLTEQFFFPREKPAAWFIAREIKNTLAVKTNAPQAGQKPKGRAWNIIRQFYPSFVLIIWAYVGYLLCLLPGKADIGFSYQPWRIWENRLAKKTAEKIYRKCQEENDFEKK